MADDDKTSIEVNVTQPNRTTLALVDAKVATVDAKVSGIGELVKSENAATREALADLKGHLNGIPEAVATLRADFNALDQREKQADEDIDRRVSAIETGRARVIGWKISAAIAAGAACIGGLLGHIHIPA